MAMLHLRNCNPVTKILQIKRQGYSNFSTRPSYIHNVGKQPLHYVTVGNLLENAAIKFGNRNAIISKHQNSSLTFKEIIEKSDKLAAGFKAVTLEKNDRVGIWAPNIIEWFITMLACTRAGLITVGLNPAYEPPEIEYCINKVGMKAIVCGHKYKNRHYYESLSTIIPELEQCEPGKLESKKFPSLRTIISVDNTTKRGSYNFEEILNLGEKNANLQESEKFSSPDDPCSLMFTSGTTGRPKVAALSHFQLINNAALMGNLFEIADKHHITCLQVPFFHVFGTVCGVILSLHSGSTMVLPNDTYDPEKSFSAIKNEKCTIIYGTPTMFVDLLEQQEKNRDKISADLAFITGAPCPPQLMDDILTKLNVKRLSGGYGLTEAGGGIFVSRKTDNKNQILNTVGHVLEHMEVKVVDENGCLVPFGTPGELWVRGCCNMLEYWGDEEETKKTIKTDRWMKTGDFFVLYQDGYGNVIGRLKDMIIRGGENIYPKEIEELLLTHPDVIEVYVVGIPHKRLGEEVCAFIRTRSNAKITLENIVEFCAGKLSYFKIPSQIKIVQGFPKTTSGKVQKFKLKELVGS